MEDKSLDYLRKAGFSPGESKVYLSLLELGISTSGPIVSKSGVSTSKVYKILSRLIKKGFVSYLVKNGVRHFKAENPEKLKELFDLRQKELDSLKKGIDEILPSLISKSDLANKKSVTLVYEGIDGLKSVFDNSLKELQRGDAVYISGVTKTTEEIRNYFLHYFKKQTKIGFKVRCIFDESARFKAKERKNKLSEFRFLPKGMLTPATIDTYHDKTIFSVSNPNYILTIVIKNQEIAESFKTQFEALWKLAKP